MFAHPDAIKTIFTGDEEDLRAGEANYRLEPILGKHSLLILDGHEHLRERRLLQPPFHGDRMLAYGAVMRDIAAARGGALARGTAVRRPPRDAGRDARRDPAHGLRPGRGADEARPARRAARSPEPGREPAAPAGRAAVERQRRAARPTRFFAARERVDRLLFAEIAARRQRRRRRSRRTSSRCWSRRRTRTAARWKTRRCATS